MQSGSTQIHLNYLDNEGDKIEVEDSNDLSEGLMFAQQEMSPKILKFLVDTYEGSPRRSENERFRQVEIQLEQEVQEIFQSAISEHHFEEEPIVNYEIFDEPELKKIEFIGEHPNNPDHILFENIEIIEKYDEPELVGEIHDDAPEEDAEPVIVDEVLEEVIEDRPLQIPEQQE